MSNLFEINIEQINALYGHDLSSPQISHSPADRLFVCLAARVLVNNSGWSVRSVYASGLSSVVYQFDHPMPAALFKAGVLNWVGLAHRSSSTADLDGYRSAPRFSVGTYHAGGHGDDNSHLTNTTGTAPTPEVSGRTVSPRT